MMSRIFLSHLVKLRSVKPSIRKRKNACLKNRREETALARLRIGHCRLTHGYLMERGPRPYCTDCIVPLTVEHILIECPSLNDDRQRLFGHIPQPLTLNNLLGEGPHFSHDAIFNFCKSIDIMNLL